MTLALIIPWKGWTNMMKQFDTPDLRQEIEMEVEQALAKLAALRPQAQQGQNQNEFINAEQQFLKTKQRLDQFNQMMGGQDAKK